MNVIGQERDENGTIQPITDNGKTIRVVGHTYGTDWIAGFYVREQKARELLREKQKRSFRVWADLCEWARETGQGYVYAVRETTWRMMRPAARVGARLRKLALACPVCRDAYLYKKGNQYVHRDYGHGAYMYHTDDTE